MKQLAFIAVIYTALVCALLTPAATTTAPAPEPMLLKHAATQPSGYGVYSVQHTADQTISNAIIDGYDQNIVAEVYAGGLTLQHVVSKNAWHDAGNLYDGQGLYVYQVKGKIEVIDSCFAWNGWQTGRPADARIEYYHGNYFNSPNATPTIEGCIYAHNSSCGVQTRVGASIHNCVFDDNGIDVLNVMGTADCEDCIFIGGHFYWSGTSWVGNTAIQNYWPVNLKNCVFIVQPGQATPPTTIAAAKTYPSGFVASGGTWSNRGEPPWTEPPKGPLVTATNCTVCGTWPGGKFTGATPYTGNGFTTHAAINYDPEPIVRQVIEGKVSAAAGVTQIQTAVTALLSK